MTDEELIAKFQERVAAGEIDLRPFGELIFGKFDQDWPARLIALARRGAAVQWKPIAEARKDGTKILVRGPGKNGGVYSTITAWPENWAGKWPSSYMGGAYGEPVEFIPLSALEQTP